MPVVNQSKPPVRVPPKAGSVLAKAKPIADVVDNSVHMILYGRNRIGKTTLACQFPKPMLLISTEPAQTGGAKSVKRIPGIDCVVLNTPAAVDDLEKLGHELRAVNTYKSVVFDSATSLEEIVLAKICGWDETANMLSWGVVSQDQYRERSSYVRKILRLYLDLKCNVIVTANEKDHNSREEAKRKPLLATVYDESYFAPAMGGATVRWASDCSDYICQLYIEKETKTVKTEVMVPVPGKPPTKKIKEEQVETGNFVRRLRLRYHPNFSAGIRGEDPDSIPEYVEASSPRGMYDEFVRIATSLRS